MVIIKKVSGDESTYGTADQVVTKATEYLIYAGGIIVAQVPRERVDEFAFVPNPQSAPHS